jgi:hypothetical protein
MNINSKINRRTPCNYMYFKKIEPFIVLYTETESLFYQTRCYGCHKFYKRITFLGL